MLLQLPCFTWHGEPVYRHTDLVQYWSTAGATIDRAARRAGVESIVLKGAAMRRFKRENELTIRLGRAMKLYRRPSSIEAIRAALERFSSPASVPLPPTMVGFEGRQLRIRYDTSGGGFVVARELEVVLGFRRDSLQEWSREFHGEFGGYLSRAQLLEERPRTAPVRTFSQRKLVLYDHGVYQVAIKSNERIHGWLLSAVLPELSPTGYLGFLAPPVVAGRDERARGTPKSPKASV